ncbi:glycosyl transferase [Bacteroidia bacterium]|nr:glycosyl transferase [Bacteroidia bacterium]
MITIIVPVYNVQSYLIKCIDSILNQTYTDWELVLINDGSSDSSGNIADSYVQKDTRIKVIHKQNGGVSSARNKGIEVAQGEYICFIDADDWIEPDFLEQFRINERNADFYISGAIYDVNNKPYSYRFYESFYSENVPMIGAEYVRQNLFDNGYPWGKLFKTSIIHQNRLFFDTQVSIHEDHLFIFKYITLIQSISVIETGSYHYLVFDDSGRKLTSKINPYTDLIWISYQFGSIIEILCTIFVLSDTIKEVLYQKFVISIHLHATWNLFLLRKATPELILKEKEFWKICLTEHPSLDKQLGRKNFVILILLRVKSLIFTKLILNVIIFCSQQRKKIVLKKLCYKDLHNKSVQFFNI